MVFSILTPGICKFQDAHLKTDTPSLLKNVTIAWYKY